MSALVVILLVIIYVSVFAEQIQARSRNQELVRRRKALDMRVKNLERRE